MIQLTRSLRIALGLCLLALGVFGASSAQAVMTWNVSGAVLNAPNSKAIQGALTATAILHTKIGGNEVLFECKRGELVEDSLEGEGFVKGGDVRFSECITKINGTTTPACEPNNNGTEKGVILTSKVHALIGTHKLADGTTHPIVVLLSLVEEVVAGVKQPVWVRFKMSAECAIGSNIPIIGESIGLIDITGAKNQIETELATHEAEIFAPLTKIWALSKTEEHKASILGKAKVNLVSGEKWSGKP